MKGEYPVTAREPRQMMSGMRGVGQMDQQMTRAGAGMMGGIPPPRPEIARLRAGQRTELRAERPLPADEPGRPQGAPGHPPGFRPARGADSRGNRAGRG